MLARVQNATLLVASRFAYNAKQHMFQSMGSVWQKQMARQQVLGAKKPMPMKQEIKPVVNVEPATSSTRAAVTNLVTKSQSLSATTLLRLEGVLML